MNRIAWVALVVTGCVPPSNQQPSYYGQQQPGYAGGPQYGGQQYGGQQAGPPAQTGLTCMQLFSCFQTCNADNTCYQSCLGQTDPATQAAASAMMQCGASRCQNQGSECVAAQCSAEIAACNASDQFAQSQQPAYGQPQQPQRPQVAEQMRPGQPHTTANLLPWLQEGTGQWIGTNHQFTFFPDGRVRRASGAVMYTDRGTYGCVSVINDTGTVRQEGDVLIMDFDTEDQNHCGHKDKGAALTVRYQITWYQYSDMPVNLLLVDLDCKRGDSMYCNNQMVRR
jgi:hypothetical protein